MHESRLIRGWLERGRRRWLGRHGLKALFLGAVMATSPLASLRAEEVEAKTTSEPESSEFDALVHRHLGLFLARADRREAFEGVALDGAATLRIRFLRTLPLARRDEILCDGLRWLLVGRLAQGGGASALFASAPEVAALTLEFYELSTTVTPDAKGKYQQTRAAEPRARFRVSRETAGRLDTAMLPEVLKGKDCLVDGAPLIDELWAP